MNFFYFSLIFSLFSTTVSLWNSLLQNSLQKTSRLTPQCFNETSQFIDSLREVAKISVECLTYRNCTIDELMSVEDYVFAIQQFDAFGKPPADILNLNTLFDGSYEECKRVSGKMYPTTYCYILIHLGANATCQEKSHVNPRLAVCMPRSCDENDQIEVFNQLTPFPLTACEVFCTDRKVEKNWKFWIFSVFLMVVVTVSITATVVDYVREKQIGMSSVNEQAYVLRVLLSFSLWSNSELILSVKEPKSGYIKCLDCIRTVSICWIITANTFNFHFPYNDIGDSIEFLKEPSVSRHLILNAFFSFDTLFVVSGVVISYVFFWNRPKRSSVLTPITWISFALKRYLKSAPPLVIYIGFFVVYGKFIQGPFVTSEMNSLLRETEICETNWWRNALYINNFGGENNSCYSITWLLAIDMQMYLIAPAPLIALFLSSTWGFVLIISGCLISVNTTFALFQFYDLPADFIGNGNHQKFRSIAFEMPWTRMSPFLMGLFVGYFLANFTKTRLKFHRIVPVCGWILSICCAFACLASNYAYDSGEEWSVFQRATYFNFTQIGWTLFILWIIIANHYRWGGPIGSFMCHPIWQPLGRLSYCAFILHRIVLYWFFNLGGKIPYAGSAMQMLLNYSLPAIVLSFVAAFFWSCLFEVPIVKIEKIFFDSKTLVKREDTSSFVRVRRGGVTSS